jgi:hypothetical protein
VVEALLRRSVPVPQHTAANESAIAAVFDAVRWLLADEIATDTPGDGGPVRRLIRRALWRHCNEATIPPECAYEIEEWAGSIHELMDRILWDRDFEDDIPALLPPDEAMEAMRRMRIDPSYFTPPPSGVPDPLAALLEERIRVVCEAIR